MGDVASWGERMTRIGAEKTDAKRHVAVVVKPREARHT